METPNRDSNQNYTCERKAVAKLRNRLQTWRHILSVEWAEFDELDWVSRAWGASGLLDEARHVIALLLHEKGTRRAKRIAGELTSLLDAAERAVDAAQQRPAVLPVLSEDAPSLPRAA